MRFDTYLVGGPKVKIMRKVTSSPYKSVFARKIFLEEDLFRMSSEEIWAEILKLIGYVRIGTEKYHYWQRRKEKIWSPSLKITHD